MNNRVLALIMALGLVTVTIPASANHLSAGGEDAVGVEETADETTKFPSVEGDDTGDASTPYGLGTSTDCDEIDPSEISADRAQAALNAKAFCGELVYQEGNDELLQKSPPDQQLADEYITNFDVVRTDYVGLFSISTCLPAFCGSLGKQVFTAVHDVGCSTDPALTECGGPAAEKGGDRFQTYSVALEYPSANAVIDANADTWRMNGWSTPQAFETFVGFIEGPGGEELTGQDLNETITKAKEDPNGLASDATAELCGFTPDAQISIGAAQTGGCEIDFEYVTDGEDFQDGRDFKDGYGNEPCKSPTYVCAANSGGHWRAILVCLGAATGAVTDSCTSNNGYTDPEYTKFHWVIAPQPSLCSGQQEPGFKTQTSAGLDFLAHDLDVYVPPTSVNGVQSTQGVDTAHRYAVDSQNEQTPVETRPRPVVNTVLGAQVPETPNTAETSLVDKPNRVEPNAADTDGDGVGDAGTGVVEDSQTQGADTAVGICTPFNGGVEPQETRDPWTNILDMDEINTGDQSAFVGVSDVGLYGNDDPNQDNTNDPGPEKFWTEGQVGMFRDSNDDGDYDQAPDESQFSSIREVGAYPLFWDMHVNATSGDVSQSSGCNFGFGTGDKLPVQMKNAGYGEETGLVQAIYLKEPTALKFGGEVQEFPAGNNIYVLESQGIHVLRENGLSTKAESFVNGIVDGLTDHPDIPSGNDAPDVVNVADRFGTNNVWDPQCQEDTGGFESQVSLLHNCEVDCSGDTIVTGYLAELTRSDNTLGGDGNIPAFTPDGKNAYSFDTGGDGYLEWTDVDPFDGNADRNDDESSRPAHHTAAENPDERHHQ